MDISKLSLEEIIDIIHNIHEFVSDVGKLISDDDLLIIAHLLEQWLES